MYDEGVAGVVASQGVAMFAPTLLHETPGRLPYVVPVAGPTWHGVDITVGPGVKRVFVLHQVADLGARGRDDKLRRKILESALIITRPNFNLSPGSHQLSKVIASKLAEVS